MEVRACAFGDDIARWGDEFDYADDTPVEIEHRISGRMLQRLSQAEYVTGTTTASVVKDAVDVFKIYTVRPPHQRFYMTAARHEIIVGASLCEQPAAGIVGVTGFLTIPRTIDASMKTAPMPSDPFVAKTVSVQNNWTQLLSPKAAWHVRRKLVQQELDLRAREKPPNADLVARLTNLMPRILSKEKKVATAAFGEFLATRELMPIRVISLQPLVAGRPLMEMLSEGDWAATRVLLRATIARLGDLQQSIWLQHGDLSPSNVLVGLDASITLIDLSRTWTNAAMLRRHNIGVSTSRVARGFDLRFFGMWLAHVCVKHPHLRQLRMLAAALVAPSRAMVDLAKLGILEHSASRRYMYHPSGSQSYRDYVQTLRTVAAWLLGGDAATAGEMRPLVDTLRYDVGPWTYAAAATNRTEVIDDAADLCRPENALRLDILVD